MLVVFRRLGSTIELGNRSEGENRVLRGGSWINNGRNVRSAIRNWNHPGKRNDNIGFRLARAQYALDEAYMTRSLSCPVGYIQTVKKKGHRHVSTAVDPREGLPVDRYGYRK